LEDRFCKSVYLFILIGLLANLTALLAISGESVRSVVIHVMTKLRQIN
jgi:hypothetical protein